MEQYTTIIITIVTVLGSAGAWQFYQNRLKLKYQAQKEDKSDQNMYRDDLRERVAVLEEKLEQERNQKEKTAQELAKVMTQLTEYKVRLEFLEKENDRLKTDEARRQYKLWDQHQVVDTNSWGSWGCSVDLLHNHAGHISTGDRNHAAQPRDRVKL